MTNFMHIHERYKTNSLKWDNMKNQFQSEDILPMWVADMDFKAPDEVNQALQTRAEHGIYGYTIVDDQVKESVTNWVEKKHNWSIHAKELVFSPGVITSIHTIIQTFTKPNDKILIQTPVYTPFFNLIKDGNRDIIECPLQENNLTYTIDFEDFEDKLRQGVKAFILCSPHNPVGRVWTREELTTMAKLCIKYDVLIISDEIHADLVFSEYKHIPIASLSDEIAQQTITCMSPTKTFNLAGLQASYMVIPNKTRHIQIQKQLGLQGFNMLNTFGVIGLHAAYSHGEKWLSDLMQYLQENKQFAIREISENTKQHIKITKSEATYLLWLDCRRLPLNDSQLQQFMIEKAKVGLNRGSSYGKQGEQFMRLNFACPRETLTQGVNRIISAVNSII